MAWDFKNARSKFASLLHTAEAEGPQVIRHGEQSFVLVTEQELEGRFAEGAKRECGKFLSAWDVLRMPPNAQLTQEESVEFDRALDRYRKRQRLSPEV